MKHRTTTTVPISAAQTQLEQTIYLSLEQIVTDGGTQSRARLSEEVVGDYAALMDEGVDLPPVLCFYDGDRYFLADGFHRVAAAKLLEWREIEAIVCQGTRRDAVLYSTGANATHGLRRTCADKRRAVLTLLADEEWGKWSNREIARSTGVDEKLIRRIKSELSAESPQIDLDYAQKCGVNKETLWLVRDKLTLGAPVTATRGGTTYTINPKENTSKIEKKIGTEPLPFSVDDVVFIHPESVEFIEYRGCWGIVQSVDTFTCSVRVSLKHTLEIRCYPREMKQISPEQAKTIREVGDRIAHLTRCNLNGASWRILEQLSRQAEFDAVDLELLHFLERSYAPAIYDN